jgi:hypothetical protein
LLDGWRRKLAVVKLNGGLGTTMGCTGPKCVSSRSICASLVEIFRPDRLLMNYGRATSQVRD